MKFSDFHFRKRNDGHGVLLISKTTRRNWNSPNVINRNSIHNFDTTESLAFAREYVAISPDPSFTRLLRFLYSVVKSLDRLLRLFSRLVAIFLDRNNTACRLYEKSDDR